MPEELYVEKNRVSDVPCSKCQALMPGLRMVEWSRKDQAPFFVLGEGKKCQCGNVVIKAEAVPDDERATLSYEGEKLLLERIDRWIPDKTFHVLKLITG